MMMQGIDGTFDGVIFLGYHASATSVEGVRAHTLSSARLAGLHLNGISIPEAGYVRFKNYRPAEVLSYLPIVERTGSHTVRFVGKDMVEISRFLEFMLRYDPALAP